jgi:hypothetical protein
MAMKKYVEEGRQLGAIKLAGEHSLTIGEFVFTLVGVAVIFAGEKVPVVGKIIAPFKLWVGLVIIFAAEWIW